MREIKLRAWDKTRKTMFEAVGYYPTLKSVDVIYKYKDGVSNKVNLYGDTFELMQFTGLKDRNNIQLQEVYEDDIIDMHGRVIGNKYQNYELLEDTNNFLIQGFGTKTWLTTYKEAVDRGCTDSE